MFQLLARLFVPDYHKTEDPVIRQKLGILSGLVGIGFNLLLFMIKLLAALLSQSVSILADAVNNLSDAGSSVVTIIGFRLAGQKPDEEHPFGHGRIEYVAGLVVAFLIFGMAVELFRSSVKKILAPTDIEFSVLIAVILLVSILVKLYMFYYNYSLGKKMGSPVLVNTAKDSISDVISTSVVLATSVIGAATGISLDGLAGSAVALFIIWQAFEATRDTVSPLIGEAPSQKLLNEVAASVMEYKGVLGVHDIVVHNYGPSKMMMSLHVEVPSSGSLLEVHDLIDEIEQDLDEKYMCTAVIHMDPVDLGDTAEQEMKEKIRKWIEAFGPELLFHDFRIIHHKQNKIIAFDVVVPFKYTVADEEIKKTLEQNCKAEYPDCSCEITIDKAQHLEEAKTAR